MYSLINPCWFGAGRPANQVKFLGYRRFRRPLVLFLFVILFVSLGLWGCGVVGLWVCGFVFWGFVGSCVSVFEVFVSLWMCLSV